ncbi:MAG: hypothetical protein ABSD31_01375, partial [Candidatus Binataceae bacterium]
MAKVHRDLLLTPKNDRPGTSELAPGWEQPLRALLQQYQLIVIGYGGNDGSLMGLLEKLEPSGFAGRILWCYREKDGDPDQRILDLLASKHGVMVPIDGFDELMLEVGNRLQFGLLDDEIEKQAKNRAKAYREQFEKLVKPGEPPLASESAKDVRRAVERLVETQSGWWGWELKARAEPDPEKREQIYRSGLKEFRKNPELMCSFANLLAGVRKNHDEAERLYRRALELAPENAIAIVMAYFATFLSRVRKNYDEAERLYRRALEIEPDNAIVMA